MDSSPGRSCPLHYRYAPEVFAVPAPPDARPLEVLYLVGGLYGNDLALERVLALFERETGNKKLIFNGDFHWFDIDPGVFAHIQRTVMCFQALRGNVETELALASTSSDAGCGCAYPDWVEQGVVECSNRIFQKLSHAASPQQRDQLKQLPMWLRADVGGVRVGIVHGDATSVAGWGFAQEVLQHAAHRAQVATWMDRAQVDVFASSHTCLPVFQAISTQQGEQSASRWILNNGAAGMPNFAGDCAGLLTRIATQPHRGAEVRYSVSLQAGVVAQAIAIEMDQAAWHSRFQAQWPPGSDAHTGYFDRIVRGPRYGLAQALRTEDKTIC